jgi:RND family efflux transporter MFP subunit
MRRIVVRNTTGRPLAAIAAASVVLTSLTVSLATGLILVDPVVAAETADDCGARCVLVTTTEAKQEIFTPMVVLTGGIEPKFQSNVAFRVSGKIVKRLVEIGDHVTPDQVLAEIDPQEQNADLDTAKAGLASSEALLTQAKVAFERQQALFKSGYTTRPTYDQAEQQLRTQQAAVDSAKAALGTAKEQFGYAQLKTGMAGIVTARDAEAGQVVQAGQTVFTIAQDGPRDAVFDVDEVLLTDPPASKTVRVALQSDPSVHTTGEVREVAPTVDAASGTVKVKVGLDFVPKRMSLGAAVLGSGDFKPRRAIVLPRGALFRWEDSPAVWLLDEKTHAVRPQVVTVDRYAGDKLILSGGVASGDQVVTAGIQFLHPGQIVGVAPAGSQP